MVRTASPTALSRQTEDRATSLQLLRSSTSGVARKQAVDQQQSQPKCPTPTFVYESPADRFDYKALLPYKCFCVTLYLVVIYADMIYRMAYQNEYLVRQTRTLTTAFSSTKEIQHYRFRYHRHTSQISVTDPRL